MSDLGGFTVNSRIDVVVDALNAHTTEAITAAVEYLLTEANLHVPHDEGTLERSGRASVDGTRGAVSYDTPYAVRQHEDMTLHHDGKGRAKWLELCLAENKTTVAKIMQTILAKGLAG